MDRIDWPRVLTGAITLGAAFLMLLIAWKLTKLLIKLMFILIALGLVAAFIAACLPPTP
jgi:hypothetical protein